ncbi:hypothetical protein ACFL9T_12970 [Thermodesulfobacteriota bacterium]
MNLLQQRIGGFLRICIAMTLVVTASCASTGSAGSTGSTSVTYNFTVEYPEPWKRLNTQKYYILSKEGAFLQYILVQQRRLDKPFRNTKKLINNDMLPKQAAEVILTEISSDESVLNFKVIENIPAAVKGYDGFRLVFTYQDKEGYMFKTIYYGFIKGAWFYSLRYNAATNHFSDEDVKTFERVLKTFKIIASGSE